MKIRLNDKAIAKLKPSPERNMIYYDKPNSRGNNWIAGFGLRITPAGARSFILNYRTVDGTERRFTIGSPPAWSVDAARKKAKELRHEIDQGGDPVRNKRELLHAPTVADLVDRFVTDYVPTRRPSTQIDYASLSRVIGKELGSRKVASIEIGDIEKLHRRLTESGRPYRANRVVGLASKMFSLAIKWRMRSDNPCRGVQKNVESRRERYLSKDELHRLMRTLDLETNQKTANIFRLLLLTGARKGELLSATWGQFDIAGGTWTKPASGTKSKKEHVVPLSRPARALIASMYEGQPKDAYVFEGLSLTGRRTQLNYIWARILKRAGIEQFRIHDLRHSYASTLASSGHSLPVIGALLGHSNPATTWRYAHLVDNALKRATEAAGAILTGEESADVALLKKKLKV